MLPLGQAGACMTQGEVEAAMAQLVVRNLEDDVIQRLRDRAERHGRSIEEEVREILRLAVMSQAEPVEPLGRRFRMLFEGIGLEEDMPEWRGQTTPALAQLQSHHGGN